MQSKLSRTTQVIISYIGMSEDDYLMRRYSNGIDFLNSVEEIDEIRKELEVNPLFWSWWNLQTLKWDMRFADSIGYGEMQKYEEKCLHEAYCRFTTFEQSIYAGAKTDRQEFAKVANNIIRKAVEKRILA